MRPFCFPEHDPERFRLVAESVQQSHHIVMDTYRFHVDSQQVFLPLTGWLKHSGAIY